ncbi:MAG: methyltransferase domain-containing protein [Candidatus Helarchaeota archaeon]|nr:methyltransferase domain-containing protein [Candidatus Helarchaeota archaeon]
MEFYEDFVEKYDNLVSWENRVKRESNFYKTIFSDNDVKKVLDCACGTGQHVIMFTQMGYDVKGSDISPSMIKKAKSNSKKFGLKIPLKISHFKNISKIFDEKFDAVICVGNSLPHLFKNKEILDSLSEIYKVLKRNGIFILEQRNFNKLIRLQNRFFPVTFREDEIFFYVLDYFPKKIVFNVIDLEISSKKFKVYTTEYNPLKKDNLVELLEKSGFKNFKYYQDHEFNTFNIYKSDNLIIICKK